MMEQQSKYILMKYKKIFLYLVYQPFVDVTDSSLCTVIFYIF